ncbi:MAG: SDR family NAD(P)-dependent oxidoreductase [Elusimicrobiota bacterium]|nr:MAG: SDR family NAD(P)-dependent oxidoreductase [Elusimicrobiota bacterium]
MDQKNPLDFHGSGEWAVVLGGSSGFGLATSKRLARAGLNILIGHKDKEGTVETVIKPHFDEIRSYGVKLVTHNVNLFDDEGRGEVFESIAQNCGAGKVRLFMQSIAAGSCRLMIEDKTPTSAASRSRGWRRPSACPPTRSRPRSTPRSTTRAATPSTRSPTPASRTARSFSRKTISRRRSS